MTEIDKKELAQLLTDIVELRNRLASIASANKAEVIFVATGLLAAQLLSDLEHVDGFDSKGFVSECQKLLELCTVYERECGRPYKLVVVSEGEEEAIVIDGSHADA